MFFNMLKEHYIQCSALACLKFKIILKIKKKIKCFNIVNKFFVKYRNLNNIYIYNYNIL